MAKKIERGSQGKLGPSWMKQGMQIPKSMGHEFKEHASEVGPGGVKVLGTIAVGLVNAMPDRARIELAEFVNAKTWVSADNLKSEDLWKFFTHLIRVHGEERPRKLPAAKQPSSDDED